MKTARTTRIPLAAACVLGALITPALRADEPPFGPEAVAEFSVKRKEVFEFVRKPAVTRDGDRVTIEFESKDYCDVAVAIEGADGGIIRHLAAGILGANAPAPLQKGALAQRIVWDGKDDFGRYVDDKGSCTVRVSLGLRAQFEKNLLWHPHRKLGDDTIISADPDGVYVYENNFLDYIRVYDHNGDYARTLYPFPADRIKAIQGLPMRPVPPDGKLVPDKVAGWGESEFTVKLLPTRPALFKVGNVYMGGMVIHDGRMGLLADRLARIGTDGTSRGMDFLGPPAAADMGKNGRRCCYSAAISPDGKWIYMTRIFWQDGWAPYQYWPNAVYRMPFTGDGEPKIFVGRPGVGKAEGLFDKPLSVACDSKGRVYVADWENDRVQVFAPDGAFLRAFEVNGPCEVQVDPRTGEIWTFSWQARTVFVHMLTKEKNLAYNNRVKRMARKFAPLDSAAGGAPKLLMEASLDFPADVQTARRPRRRAGAGSAFQLAGMYDHATVDFWSQPRRVWIVTGRTGARDSVYMLAEADGTLKLERSFDAEVADDGVRQHVPFFQREFLAVDPVRQVLYVGEPDTGEGKIFSGVIAIDIAGGRQHYLRLPAGAADMAIDAHGRMHLRVGDAVSRYDLGALPAWKEIPYDYGDERSIVASATSHGGKAVSAMTTPGGGGSSVKYDALGVSPDGKVIVGCVYGVAMTDRDTPDKPADYGGKRWQPQLYPGRPRSHFVHVFDAHGRMLHEDVLAGGGMFTGGLDMDLRGNLYANIRSKRILDGKVYGRNGDGTIMKFPPDHSRFLTDSKPMVALDAAPARPKEVAGLWSDKALWAYGGISAGSTNHCWCRHGQFKVDSFGRVFAPEADRYSIAVLDTNGQLIMRIGQYGNADDGKPLTTGPAGAVHRSIGGDEVALFDAHYVTTDTDRRVFISDVGNGRIVSVKLDYHANERVALKEVPDAGRSE